MLQEFAGLHRESIIKYANENLSAMGDWEEQFTMEKALISAFDRLDSDIMTDAFTGKLNPSLASIALTGTVFTEYSGQLLIFSLRGVHCCQAMV